MEWNDGGGYGCDERRRRRSSVARVREPEKREEAIGESESGPGGAWHPQGDGETGREAGGGLGACVRTASTRSASFWRGGDDGWQRQSAGPGKWRQVSGPGNSSALFYFYSVLYFSSVFVLFNSFATVLN